MRVQHTVNPQISEDTEGAECLLGLSDSVQQVNLDGFGSSTTDARNLLLAGGEFTLPLTTVSAIHGFWVRSDGDFDLRVNGGSLIQIRRGKTDATTDATSARVFMEAMVTDIKVTPQSDQRVHWAAWGDPL